MSTQQDQNMGHEQQLDDFVARSRFRSEVYQEVLKYAALEAIRRPPPIPPEPPPRRVQRVGELCWLATKKAGRWLFRNLTIDIGEKLLPENEDADQPIIIDINPSESGSDDSSLFAWTDPFSIDEEE